MDPTLPNQISRRAMLRHSAGGLGALGLTALLAEESGLAAAANTVNPLVPKQPHIKPRAKRVILLFMKGGPSHLDTFDPKPRLTRDHGKTVPFKLSLSFDPSGYGGLMKSPFTFKQYGESGIAISELFPNVARHADDLCVIRSMVGDGLDHGAAVLQLFTGTINFTRPSVGAWVLYGLGTENQSLPGFIIIKPPMSHGGARQWSASFLPGVYQGTPIGTSRVETEELKKEPIEHLLAKGVTPQQQRYELEALEKMNRRHARLRNFEPELEERIQSFDLASRMQTGAGEVFDVEKESEATKKLYGLNDKTTRDFGWQCLLARRLAENGVRFVQCTHDNWDQHSELARLHSRNAKQVDKPIAALLQDLKARGLLEDTLVIWAGEFGRTPFAQYDGRDHHPYGYSIWLAGGGVKPGFIYGATDEFGYHAVEDRMHVHDLHATILHLMGLEHKKLTYRYAGRDFRLTDVHGVVARKILA